MSLVTQWVRGNCMVVEADCEHWFESESLSLDLDDEVDCPVCADIEKRVKAARVEGMKEASKLAKDHTWIDVPGGEQAVMDAIATLIVKLEAEE